MSTHPPTSVDTLLERARAQLHRLSPHEAAAAARDGALLIDTRYGALRDRGGLVPGALIVERNELEWRLDPHGGHRLPEVTGHDVRGWCSATRGTPPASRRSPSTSSAWRGPPTSSVASRRGGRRGCRYDTPISRPSRLRPSRADASPFCRVRRPRGGVACPIRRTGVPERATVQRGTVRLAVAYASDPPRAHLRARRSWARDRCAP